MATKSWAVGLVLLCTLLTSAGQLFLKLGSKTVSLNFGLLTNYPLMAGIVLYLTSAVMLIIALKGGELSVLYPFIATSFVWVSLLSTRFLGEAMGSWKWLGIAVIIAGVSFVGIGSKNRRINRGKRNKK